ncbi:hypothetical protein ZWY2020_013883 [Hordeum vulgare]|nr:hypothetical protein ZWY2020_013883 [Hordeum vulgare]
MRHSSSRSTPREILRYDDLAQATYDAFDNRYWSRNCGTCLHGLRRMLPALGLAGHGHPNVENRSLGCDERVVYEEVLQAELQYLHPHLGINGSVGLNPNPLVNIYGVIGTKALAFGLDVAFDTASGDFTKYNARYLWCSIIKFRTRRKHQVLPTTMCSSPPCGAKIAHNFSSNENTITVGTQHELDPLTTLKGRYNNFGIVSALIQHAWRPMSLITFSTEVDTKAIEKSPKFGLALSPKP